MIGPFICPPLTLRLSGLRKSGAAVQLYVRGQIMYAEISAAVASAKTALDIAKAAHGLSNYNELVSAVSEVNTKLVQATVVALASLEKQSALNSEIANLKNKLREVEDWEGQMKRYKLHVFPTGALAYALQPGMEQGEPIHYLCASCVDKKQKSTLSAFKTVFS